MYCMFPIGYDKYLVIHVVRCTSNIINLFMCVNIYLYIQSMVYICTPTYTLVKSPCLSPPGGLSLPHNKVRGLLDIYLFTRRRLFLTS